MNDLVEILIRASYGKSANPNAQENRNSDFLDGYATGRYSEVGPFKAIAAELKRRGGKSTAAFAEWKRGFWSGRLERTLEAPSARQTCDQDACASGVS